MDYTTIYSDFIADRRSQESALVDSGDYFERHHITPRSLGGEDSPSNIICLSAEDHYFAHLLLAKAYGGVMWLALRAMYNLPSGGRVLDLIRGRAMFGYARVRAAKYFSENYSGANNPNSDMEEHVFANLNGGVVRGTRLEVMEETGLTNRAVSALILGQKHTYNGWYSVSANPEGRTGIDWSEHPMSCKEVFKLYHHDGREWSGTKRDFQAEFGQKLYFQSEGGHCAGWYKSKDDADKHDENMKERCTAISRTRGDISGANNPRADNTTYCFENEETGEIVNKTRTQMAKDYGLKSSQLTAVLKGRQFAAGDWKLHGMKRQRAKFRRAK